MADYKKMYIILCSAISEAMDEPPDKMKQQLQDALYEAEEVYIRTCGEDGGDSKQLG